MKTTYNTIGIGEVLWDILPDGKMLGGAPTNFAYHTHQLGGQGSIISAVGNDPLGEEIIQNIKKLEVEDHLLISEKPTGTVTVKLDSGIPSYTIHEQVAWDFIELTRDSNKALVQADAICFGSLAQRHKVSREAIWHALEMVSENCLKVFDINLRQHFYSKEIIEKSLLFANAFKLNDEELEILGEMFGLEGSDDEKCKLLIHAFNLDVLALTKGTSGSILYSEEDRSELPTPMVEVADTIGAGDSFTASLTMGLLQKASLKNVHQLAVDVSAFVCTQNGATPILPDNLKEKSRKLMDQLSG